MKEHLTKLIKLNGPISISEFISEALFNPDHGYYNQKNPFGKKGDFITAPEISQLFGELIGAYLMSIWQSSYKSKEINLVEMGAGNGTLMKDLLRVADKIPDFLQKVTINIIEISPRLQEVQKETLKNYKINWWNNFDDFYKSNQSKPIFFVANELFDCFAIKQFVKTNKGWVEKTVSLNQEDQIEFSISNYNEIIDKEISNMTQSLDVKQGAVFEYSEVAQSLMQQLSQAVGKSKGIGIIIDYGYVENELKDTLQALKNHQYCDIIKNVGESDLTSLVNFESLKNIAIKEDLEVSLITQGEFLKSLGIDQRLEMLCNNKEQSLAKEARSAVARLCKSDQMGALFKCLLFWPSTN